ncbi:MAG: hypothetical protein ACJAZB_001438 [Psychrosphaera sp.]|jgi:hypothetical protein
MNIILLLKGSILLLVIYQLIACSTMGNVAKGTFKLGTDIYKAQPQKITDNYPFIFKQTFYSSELLITNYADWRIRILSEENLLGYLDNYEVLVDLEYEMEFQVYRETVPLVLESHAIINIHDRELYSFEFSFSKDGEDFWRIFDEHRFNFDKPRFNYLLSPTLPLEQRKHVHSIEYNYVPHWGFLTLRRFMQLYRRMDEKRWDDFCFWNNYAYDDSTVCGDIRIEDDPDSMQGAHN